MDRTPGVRSLDLIAELVRSERSTWLSHFDALDTKAGVVLGFAGALAALAPASAGWIVDVGRAFAVVGALLALASYWPRAYQVIDVRAVREHYLAAQPEFTRLHLLDTQIGMTDNSRTEIRRKAIRLRLAMAFLSLAAITVSIGAAVD